MVRIKGANSDYEYSVDTEQVEKIEPLPGELYLKLFICPYDEPSRVEKHQGEGTWCEGTNLTCPHEPENEEEKHQGNNLGHALILLHQKDGIKLVTDNDNQIVVNQNGNIQLLPSPGGQVEVQLRPSQGGQAEVNGAFRVKHQSDLLLEISSQKISLQVGDAKISLSPAGNIELSTLDGQGEVTIKGNLTIQGNLTVTGKILGNFDLSEASVSLSEASLTAITEEVRKRLQQPEGGEVNQL